jgi:hypothetical protein
MSGAATGRFIPSRWQTGRRTDARIPHREARRGQTHPLESEGRCELYGDYLSEWSALLDAIGAAHEDGENGLDAEVRIARDEGSEELAWQLGDAYPRLTMPVSNDNPGAHCRSP